MPVMAPEAINELKLRFRVQLSALNPITMGINPHIVPIISPYPADDKGVTLSRLLVAFR